MTSSTPSKHLGSCHCGAVTFAVEVDLASARIARCNCTICMKVAQLGTHVKPSQFTLTSDPAKVASYAWRDAAVSTRYFCPTCGIHVFGKGHIPEIGGDYVSVNLNCLDGFDVATLPVVYWDGRHDNWMAGPRATPWPV